MFGFGENSPTKTYKRNSRMGGKSEKQTSAEEEHKFSNKYTEKREEKHWIT